MTKKRTVKKHTLIFNKNYFLWIVVLILCILQGLSLWHIAKLREYSNHSSELSMRFLLRNAEEDRYQYPIIDVSENRVYIPEARIYLPLNESSRNIRYDYREHGTGSESKTLYFSTSSVVGRQIGAQYESCDKMVTLSPDEATQIPRGKADGTINLTKDGLKNVFMHPDTTCWEQNWYADLKQDLLEVVKEAKNY